MEKDPDDLISKLPEFILHKILSSLPRRDAGRTSVLSKRWNRVWESFPILDFYDFVYISKFTFRPRSDPRSLEAVTNFLSKAKKQLTWFRDSELRVERFVLLTTLSNPSPNSAAIVKQCLELALECKASEIGLHLNTAYYPEQDLLETSSFSDHAKKFHFLRTLGISGIRATEKTMRDIVRNCPNLRALSLNSVEGLKSLHISKLDGLEFVSISSTQLLGVEIDAPSLRVFWFASSLKERPNSTFINLTSCRGLRELSLEGLAVTDESFRSLLSGLPLLQDLEVWCCQMLQRVVISSPHLKRLLIRGCNKVKAVEIDAPSLSSFSYEAETLSRLSLTNIPSRFQIYHNLRCNPVNNSHFIKMRQFLATSTTGELLTVTIDTWEVIFDREELIKEVIPPAFQLQHLKLKFARKNSKFVIQTLVDGLLWSCHPRAISVSSGTVFENCIIKILCESLFETEKYPTCCGSSHIKCWRHDFKSARIESFGVNWRALLENLACDGSECPVICFKLEWYDFI